MTTSHEEDPNPGRVITAVEKGAEVAAGSGVYVFPASLEQSRYWILDQLEGASTASNMAIAFRLEGPVEAHLVEQSVRALTARHEALRTDFRMVDGELSQVIAEEPLYSFSVSDLRGLEPGERQQRAETLIHEHSHVHIELAGGPVFFAKLIHVTDQDHFLAFTIHHIVCDGWSNGILVRDFAELYASFKENRPAALPVLPFQFADFTVWQREWLESDAARSALDFWREYTQRRTQAIDLPVDRLRTAKKSYPGNIESYLLPAELNARLKNYCKANDATMHQVLLAAFEGLIARYTGQTEFLLGSTIANRTQPGMENVVGRFANPQVILAGVQGDPSYRELLRRVIDWSTRSYAHQDLPFSRLMEEFQLDQSGATSQFLQVYFVYQKAFMQPQRAGALKIIPRPSVSGGVNFDLLVSVVERNEGPRLQIEYNTVLFEKWRIRALLAMYTRVLSAVMDADTLRVSEFPLLHPEEKAALALACSSPLPLNLLSESIPSRLDRIAAELGDVPAIVAGNLRIGWDALRSKSLLFAAGLEKLGIKAGDTVALRMEPGLDAAAAAIAILRCGAVVLPVSAATDVAEWNLILLSFQPSLALAQSSFVEQFSTLTSFEQLSRAAGTGKAEPSYLAASSIAWLNLYVGRKGNYQASPVSHEASLKTVLGAASTLDMRRRDTVAVWPAEASSHAWIDLLLPLLAGATVVYPNGGAAAQFQALLDHEQITFALGAPAGFADLLASGWKGDRRLRLICHGVGVAAANLKRLAGGPCMVDALYLSPLTAGPFAISPVRDAGQEEFPLLPLAGQQLLVVEPSGAPAPFGVTGELAVRQPVLNSGQENPEELRTGYLARYSPHRGIEITGLADRLIGFSGYRLRLEELEDHLYRDPEIATAEALVLNSPGRPPALTAYVTGRAKCRPTSRAITAKLKLEAPDYLSSAEILSVDRIPRQADGTVDVSRLPLPDAPLPEADAPAELIPPRDALETRLIAIWEEVLGVRGIGIRNSFFTLGGYSLMIVRLFARVNKAFGTSLPITTIFNAPTIEQLADILRGHRMYSSLVPVQTSGSKSPFFMVHSYLLYEGFRKVLGPDRPFYGLRELDPNEHISIEDRVSSYVKEIRSVQPKGPYYLGGWCAAGPLTVETARQLYEAGEQVPLVVLLDSWRPGYAGEFSNSNNPQLSARAVLRRKYRYHRMNLRLLSSKAKAKYLWGFAVGKIKKSRDNFYLKHWGSAQRLSSYFGISLPHFMHNVSQNTLAAVKEYRGRPFPGRITLIRATDAPYLPQADPACGWDEMVQSGVEVLFTPGNHESMFLDPNLKALGSLINVCLNRAEGLSEAEANEL